MLSKFKSVIYGTSSTADDIYTRKKIRSTLPRSASFRDYLSQGLSRVRESNNGEDDDESTDDVNLTVAARQTSHNGLSNGAQSNADHPYPSPYSPDYDSLSPNYSLELVSDHSGAKKLPKFRYSRPEFLLLRTDDEISVSADHQIRPIILPRDVSRLPWKSGYAECINAGKSVRNEDQAASYQDVAVTKSSVVNGVRKNNSNRSIEDQIPWVYFGIFDGHAGPAVAVAAAAQLHNIISAKLHHIAELLIALEFDQEYAKDDNLESDDLELSNQSDDVKGKQQNSGCEADKNQDQQDPTDDQIDSKDEAAQVTSDNCKKKEQFHSSDSHEQEISPHVENETSKKGKLVDIELKDPTEEDDEPVPTEHLTQKSSTSTQLREELVPPTKSTSNGSNELTNAINKRDDSTTEAQDNGDAAGPKEFRGQNPLPKLSDADSYLASLSWKLYRSNITVDKLITGVLESAFWEMDALIERDKKLYKMAGGCTALVSLFILGKLYVCNAGDSRAIVYKNKKVVPVSFDFTPTSERERILRLGLQRPELLGNEFTHLDFLRRPTRSDLGKKFLYKDAYMTGWSLKTINYNDLKFPLVWGEGKRSRVLATIGVTRGFGDHELRTQHGQLPIKPFLTPEPEVRIMPLQHDETLTDEDVIIMGTDGLWDVTSNEEAAEIVKKSFGHCLDKEDSRAKYRYLTAAQDLVIHSRGHTTEWNSVWRTKDSRIASMDDIAVFVIPLKQYRDEYLEWLDLRNQARRRRGSGGSTESGDDDDAYYDDDDDDSCSKMRQPQGPFRAPSASSAATTQQ